MMRYAYEISTLGVMLTGGKNTSAWLDLHGVCFTPGRVHLRPPT